jgi:hypothetical protein
VAKARNAPCECGSGKKYKQCCLDKDSEQAAQRAAAAAVVARQRPDFDTGDGLDELSNGARDLIQAGRYAEAEVAIAELQKQFPDCIDWLERSAMLHERRGDPRLAADFYRRCIEYVAAHDGDFEEGSTDWMHAKVAKLDPTPVTAR